MGKKKVATQTGVAPEGAVQVSKAEEKASSGAGVSRRVEQGRVYVNTSFNNTMITVTDEKGAALAWASAGSLGFNGPKKATPFAASKVVAVLAEKLKKSGPVNVEVIVSGVGGGRDSAVRSLVNQGFNVLAVRDVTPIPHNGPRPKKIRRV